MWGAVTRTLAGNPPDTWKLTLDYEAAPPAGGATAAGASAESLPALLVPDAGALTHQGAGATPSGSPSKAASLSGSPGRGVSMLGAAEAAWKARRRAAEARHYETVEVRGERARKKKAFAFVHARARAGWCRAALFNLASARRPSRHTRARHPPPSSSPSPPPPLTGRMEGHRHRRSRRHPRR